MQNNNDTNRQSNKTVNLARAIMMLVKNADFKKEKTLLSKIETAAYELVDTTHNDETKIKGQLSYIHDLMIMARQVNIFLEENTIFIIGVINEISKIYETKLEINNEEIINEKIRDILEGGELSETNNISIGMNIERGDAKNLETKNLEIKNLETKAKGQDQNTLNIEKTKNVENIKDTKNTNSKSDTKNENKFLRDSNQKSTNLENNRKLSRREEVLKVLSKTPVSIKDVSDKVLGCSEKTLQRELNTLVDLKLAARIGEKRWSRYVLVN